MMSKNEIKIWLIWFSMLLTLLFMTSCSVLKKSKETTATSKQTSISEVKKDSSNVIEKNAAINDNFKAKIPEVNTDDEDFNVKCTEVIDQLLSQINTQKSSGGNNYKLYYDLEKRLLELQIQIAATQNQKVETNNSENVEETKEETFVESSEKVIKRVPFWIWLVLLFVFRKPLLGFLLELFPQFKGIGWLSRLLG